MGARGERITERSGGGSLLEKEGLDARGYCFFLGGACSR